MKYLLVAKPGDHQFLFDPLDASEKTEYFEFGVGRGTEHPPRWEKKLPYFTPINLANRKA